MTSNFDFQLRTRAIFGAGAIERLGELSRESGFKRTLTRCGSRPGQLWTRC